MPPLTVANPTWWIWSNIEGDPEHPIWDNPYVATFIRFQANRTGALSQSNGGPPFAAAGVTPFEGTGLYPAQTIFVVGDTLANMEARCVLAGEALAKRTIDWIRCRRALNGVRPISIFWQNFGNTSGDGSSHFPNSVSLFRYEGDELLSESINTIARRRNPFSAAAVHLNAIVCGTAAQFLYDNLTADERDAIVRLYWDIEEGFNISTAMGSNGDGWLVPLVRGTGNPFDLARYANEIVAEDDDTEYTLQGLYELEYDRMMAEIELVPPGATGSAPATAGMLTRQEPFDAEANWTSYSNHVIRDWATESVFDLTRAYAMRKAIFDPFKARFPAIETGEWGVCQSQFPLAATTFRGAVRYSANDRAPSTNRYQRGHGLDHNNQIHYLPASHPVGEMGPVLSELAGLAETLADFPEAMLRAWKANSARAIAGSPKSLVPWIDFPGRSRTISTFAGTALGSYARTNADWLQQCRDLLELGVTEIKVWNTIFSGAPPEAYEEQYDALNAMILQLGNEATDEWDFTDNFNRADGAPGAPWVTLALGGIGDLAILTNRLTNTTSGVKVMRNSTDMGGGDMEAEVDVVGIATTSNNALAVMLRMEAAANRDGILFQYAKNTTTWSIIKRVSNSNTTLTSVVQAAPATPFTVRAYAVGDDLRLYVDGELLLSVTDPNTNLRTFPFSGLYISPASASEGIVYDDFKVRALDSGVDPEPIDHPIVLEEGFVTADAGALYLNSTLEPTNAVVVEDITVTGSETGAQIATVTNIIENGAIPGGGYRLTIEFSVPLPFTLTEDVTVSIPQDGITADPDQFLIAVEDFPIDNKPEPPLGFGGGSGGRSNVTRMTFIGNRPNPKPFIIWLDEDEIDNPDGLLT